MTRKPKRRLSRFHLPVVLILLVLLIGLFVYALREQMMFFVFLAVGLLITIIILYLFHLRLTHKKSRLNLEKEDYFEKANLMRVDLEKEISQIASLRKKIVRYGDLKGLVENLTNTFSLEDTNHALVRETARLMERPEVTIILYLVITERNDLSVVSARRGRTRIRPKSTHGDIFDRWVASQAKPLLVEDTKSDFRFDLGKVNMKDKRTINSLMSVPLLSHDRMLGILRVDSPQVKAFDSEDWRLLRTIGELGAVAIENAELLERVEELAIRDGLTGLFLRRHLNERLDEELKQSARSHQSLSFLMVDIDYFKQYNDNYGHTAGDIVLKILGEILGKFFQGPGQIVSRYGGEEFAVVLPHCSKEKALERAEALRDKIQRKEIILRRERTSVTVSIGVATYPDDAQDKEVLIHKADHALYQAKDQGRNKVIAA